MKDKLLYCLSAIMCLAIVTHIGNTFFKTDLFLLKYEINNSEILETNNQNAEFEKYEKQAYTLDIAINDTSVESIEIDGFNSKDDALEFAKKISESKGIKYKKIKVYALGKTSIVYDENTLNNRRNHSKKINLIKNNIDQMELNDSSDLNKINIVLKYMSDNFTYKSQQDSTLEMIENGKGNCVAYASYFKNSMDLLNIDCDIVRGTAGGGHAWNRVRIDNQDYWVDACWFDGNDRYTPKYSLTENLWDNHSFKEVSNSYKFN